MCERRRKDMYEYDGIWKIPVIPTVKQPDIINIWSNSSDFYIKSATSAAMNEEMSQNSQRKFGDVMHDGAACFKGNMMSPLN